MNMTRILEPGPAAPVVARDPRPSTVRQGSRLPVLPVVRHYSEPRTGASRRGEDGRIAVTTGGPVGPEGSVSDLVRAAAAGDAAAWNELVDRFSPLVWSICMRCRLSRADAADVSQTVWLRLTERLDTLREPAALPGWIATTTRRECLRTIERKHGEVLSPMEIDVAADQESTDPARALLQHERRDALLAALGELPESARRLLLMLMADPPIPYAQISEALGIPIGSIGPTRARHLQKLRQSPALAGLAPTPMTGGDQR
jgi:RNA polymerase sigma factor (sigma-70 family)